MRSISDHIYDIAINSIKANAKHIELEINLNDENKSFIFKVKDDGSGIEKEKLEKIFDPFYTTRDKKIRKVGLGLPLLKYNAEITKGHVKIDSIFGEGTIIEAMFKTSSFDIPEIGDIPSTVTGLITYSEDIEWTIKFIHNDEMEILTTSEIREVLGDIPLNNVHVIPVIEDIIKNIVNGLSLKY